MSIPLDLDLRFNLDDFDDPKDPKSAGKLTELNLANAERIFGELRAKDAAAHSAIAADAAYEAHRSEENCDCPGGPLCACHYDRCEQAGIYICEHRCSGKRGRP